jgi:uncharacterized cupin superfamily protein
MSAPPPMINLNDLETTSFGKGANFSATLGRIGGLLGMKKMGCGLVVLEPGKRAWPFHEHYGQEELFIILEGSGTIRFGDDSFPVNADDVIFTPPGKGTAHQIINTSDAPLRYLALSTAADPELCYYPDSGKYNAISYADGTGTHMIAHEDARLDYWDGEDTAD